MSCRGLLLVALAAVLAAPAYGQWNGRGGPRNRNLKGTIGAIANGALKMETEGDQSQTVLVTMTAGTKLHYSGTATVEFLRPRPGRRVHRRAATRNTTPRPPSLN